MAARVLYCGDTSLTAAAAYLGGVLGSAGVAFDHLASDVTATAADLAPERSLYILSDYPAARLSADLQAELVRRVERGAGLLMIGGWESFHGLGGDWDGTPVAKILPVEIGKDDDRMNSDRPMVVTPGPKGAGHPILEGLPWADRPPYVGGLNRLKARPDAEVLLEATRFMIRRDSSETRFTPGEVLPFLVAGRHGEGRTLALATDLAPHWVAGMVDWGDRRVACRAPGANEVEVGDLYVRFAVGLARWAGRLA